MAVAKKDKNAEKSTRERKGLTDNQRWVYGFMLFFFSLFVLLSVVSYYFYWADDQGAVRGGALWKGEVSVLNNGGKLGALLGHWIVGEWFGVFGIAIPVVLTILSLRIIRYRPLFLRKSVRLSLIVMILGSLSLGFLFGSKWTVFGTGLGGAHGILVAAWIESYLGGLGTGLLLLLAWILLAVYINRNTIKVVNRVGKEILDNSVKVGEAVTRQAADLVPHINLAKTGKEHDDSHVQKGEESHPLPRRLSEPEREPMKGSMKEPVVEASKEIPLTPEAVSSGLLDDVLMTDKKIEGEPGFEVTDLRDSREEEEGVFKVVRVTDRADSQNLKTESGIGKEEIVAETNVPEIIDLTKDDSAIRASEETAAEQVQESVEEGDFEIVEKSDTAPLSVGGVVESAVNGRFVKSDDGMEIVVAAKKDVLLDDDQIENSLYDPTKELSKYQRPPVEILEDHSVDVRVTEEEIYENKNRIIETLENFGISIQKIKATIGPTVTLYEIVPAPGVRISKIKNLEDDIALSLSALGIRIIAPMPGKGTIGIEVPNKDKEVVSMYSVIKSMKFQESKYDLPVVLGKTIQNETYVIDLAKMPHLLMAGATGQGKSVGLNAILASLLYKKHPAELKLVLVDPKKVELTLYAKLEKHFLAKMPGEDDAIITDTHKVIYTLNSLCIEMDNRYDLLRKAEVRNIKEYNEKFTKRKLNPEKGHRYLPYIVVIIDEFADMIMTAGREIETPIARLAQLARAIGIHLVIATQRPTTNIITGLIKANFPARIAFRVTSMIDSRTILDQPGANQLIGRGDMLVSTGSDVTRVQCAFIDTPEVERMTEFIGNQRGYPSAYELPEYTPEDAGGSVKSADMGQLDPMFEEVARFIVQNQQGSTSSIQRRFSIGYNRAGRIMDQIEAAGIVGRAEGSKPREVLIADMQSLEMLLSNLRQF